MKKPLLVTLSSLAALAVGLTIGGFAVGSSISSSSNKDWYAVAGGGESSGQMGMDSTGMADAKGSGMGSTVGSEVDRSVIKTANLTVETADIKAAISKARATAAKFSGSIDNWSQQANNEGQIWNVSASIRVPADQLDAALAEFGAIGKVTGQDVSNSDVTTQVIDINARVASLKASVARLVDLVAKAKSTADLLAAETALSERQAELQSLEQQQKYLTDQVDMSTIWLQLYTEGLGPVAAPTNFIDGFIQGWRALLQFFGWTGVAVGWFVPWLVLLVPGGAIIWFAVGRLRRRAKAIK